MRCLGRKAAVADAASAEEGSGWICSSWTSKGEAGQLGHGSQEGGGRWSWGFESIEKRERRAACIRPHVRPTDKS